MNFFSRFILILLIVVFASCSKETVKKSLIKEKSLDTQVLEAYKEGKIALEKGDVLFAAKKFNEAEILFPQSEWAPKSALMAAYSYYIQDYYADSIAELERFIKIYSNHQYLDYAYYLLAICYYEQIVDVERDAAMTRLAMEAFEELVRRFPQGTYARDAQLKIDLTRSHLAGKEMAVGRYYLNNQFYSAALRRFHIVIDTYDTTNQAPEALQRSAEAYLALGLMEEASRMQQVAVYNYPDSIWTQRLNKLIADPEKPPPKGLFERSVNAVTSIFD